VSDDPETVAVITDIPANLAAPQAALARIEELGIESVFCGGDLIGKIPRHGRVVGIAAATIGAIGALMNVGGAPPWWSIGVVAVAFSASTASSCSASRKTSEQSRPEHGPRLARPGPRTQSKADRRARGRP
jgi:hypothetical protein